MSFISLNCNKTLIYVAIYWLLEIFFRLFRKLEPEYFKLVDNKIQKEYLLVIYSVAGDLLAGFLVLYIKKLSKSYKEKEQERIKGKDEVSTKLTLIYEEKLLVTKKNVFIKIIIISVLEYIELSNYWIGYAITGSKEEKITQPIRRDFSFIVDIINRYLFSIFILKIKIFKHHKVSFIIMIVGFLFILTSDIIFLTSIHIPDDTGKVLLFTAILLLKCFAYPYEHTLIKQLFQENYILPEKLQFVRGLINSIIVIIIAIIFYFSFNLSSIFTVNVEIILSAIAYVIISFLKSFILLKVIYNMSLQSVSFLTISKSFGNCIFLLYDIVKKNNYIVEDSVFFLISILGFLIILFATLLYDEVLIINKWGLNFNTKKHIEGRIEIEMQDSKEVDDEIKLLPALTQTEDRINSESTI